MEPRVEHEPAIPSGNKLNPFDGVTSAERLAARAYILGGAILKRWAELTNETGEVVMDEKHWIPAKQAWERLSISERQFYRVVKEYEIPNVRIGRLVRYQWAAIEKALGLPADESSESH